VNIFLLGNVERISHHNGGSSKELIGNINNIQTAAGEISAQPFSTHIHTNPIDITYSCSIMFMLLQKT